MLGVHCAQKHLFLNDCPNAILFWTGTEDDPGGPAIDHMALQTLAFVVAMTDIRRPGL